MNEEKAREEVAKVEEKGKSIDELLEERRKLEYRISEMYGYLVSIHERVASIQTIVWLLAGANVGALIVLTVMLVS